MKFLFKISILLFSALLITNCGKNSMESKQAAARLTDNTGSNNSSGTDTQVEEPLVAPDSVLKASDIPNDLLNIITQAPTTGGNSFLSGLLGGSGCGILSTVLQIGASYFLGPFAASVVPMLTNLIFKCGTQNSSLVSLIPGGSSQTNQIFTVLSQVLQVAQQGKDPFSLINGIKNPQDLSGMLNIVSELLKKTNDPKLQQVFNLLNGFVSNYGGTVGTCGSMNTVACEVFNIINQVRSNKGLSALIPNDKCVAAAQSHSKDMFTNLILSHLSSNGKTVKERMLDFGINGAWAENIVKGKNLTPEQAVQMWMNSAGHAKNILNPTFTSGGVGFINGYFTQCLTN